MFFGLFHVELYAFVFLEFGVKPGEFCFDAGFFNAERVEVEFFFSGLFLEPEVFVFERVNIVAEFVSFVEEAFVLAEEFCLVLFFLFELFFFAFGDVVEVFDFVFKAGFFFFEVFEEFLDVVGVSAEDVFELHVGIFLFCFEADVFLFEFSLFFFEGVELGEEPWVAKLGYFCAELLFLDFELGERLCFLADLVFDVVDVFAEGFDGFFEVFFVLLVGFQVSGVEVEAFFLFDNVSFEVCFEFSELGDLVFVLLPALFERAEAVFNVGDVFADLVKFFVDFFFFEAAGFFVPVPSGHRAGELADIAVEGDHAGFADADFSRDVNIVDDEGVAEDV